jgi:hypothetical protein
LEFLAEGRHIEAGKLPFDSHKEQASFVVLVLIGMHDVCAMPVKKARNSRHESFAVRTVYEEDDRVTHK